MDDRPELIEQLVDAISSRRRIRLVYRRAKDDVTSIHDVAPVDIRGGDRPTTLQKPYLWAWCFAEDELEMHALDRIVKVLPLDQPFDPRYILENWPESHWPRPKGWNVPRDW